MTDLVEGVLDGDQRSLARTISKVEDREPGHRDLVSALYRHGGDADVLGVTGPPGAGKSTLVDRVVAAYRERGETVGVLAIDPASPFTGGAVLGDRIRMAENAGDTGVFFRSMSARGRPGGLAVAAAGAVTALDAAGFDRVIVETVGAGQSEVDVVRAADTVAVLVPPGGGDDVQTLKAGILEIADLFAVNKADLDGADRTVSRLREMLRERESVVGSAHDDRTEGGDGVDDGTGEASGNGRWTPPILETVADRGEGVEALVTAVDDHLAHLDATGARQRGERERATAAIRTLLSADVETLLEDHLERHGGLEPHVEAVLARETDPYAVVDDLLAPLRAALGEDGDDREGAGDGDPRHR